MNVCPECNLTNVELYVAGLCPSCAGKYITKQVERIKELEAENANWKQRYIEAVNDLKQALKG